MRRPTTGGAATAITPGSTIFFKAAVVAMSTQRAVSGFAVPSSSPLISRNCRRISLIISNAALPAASTVRGTRKKGMMRICGESSLQGGTPLRAGVFWSP